MPADSSQYDKDLYAALIFERYNRPLADILQEDAPRPVPELLKERHRRPAAPRRSAPFHPNPDPNAAQHRALALAETAPRRRAT
ncbi:hypothetical protein [Streptomyces sp. NPDC058657]|uniref:hypothetical protein n=1 Tax=unclassified Streptomyces TaxID=2593676 RepID=UPI003650B5C1